MDPPRAELGAYMRLSGAPQLASVGTYLVVSLRKSECAEETRVAVMGGASGRDDAILSR